MPPTPSSGLGLVPGTDVLVVPAVVRTLALVGLAGDALEDRVTSALAENPALRRAARVPCHGCGAPAARGLCGGCAGGAGGGGRRTAAEPAVRPFDDLAVLARCALPAGSPAATAAVDVVLAHLTGRGVLDTPPAGIAALHGLAAETVEAALAAVRTVGPVGIAQPSVAAMLAEQARAVVEAGGAPPWFVDLVAGHLDAVAAGDADRVAAALDVPATEVGAAFTLVRTALRPLAAPDPADSTPPAAPDVLVDRAADGDLVVRVPDSRRLGLRVVAGPRRVRDDAAAAAWLEPHLRAARELVRQVDARADVLHRVARCAVSRQRGFFEHGPAGHVPLRRADVAAEVGLHPSTVSRAVAGKVLRHPDGRLGPLAELFGTTTAVEDLVRRLLVATPMSDERLRAVLASHGHAVARRTVAKYRGRLGLPATGARRS